MADWKTMMTQFQGGYSTAEEFSDWQPPAGISFHAVPTKVRTGEMNMDTEKGKQTVPYWSLTLEMLDGQDPETGQDLTGQTFSIFYSVKILGMLKSLVRKLAGGQEINDLVVADQLLQSCQAKYVFTCSSKVGKKAGTTNVRVDSVEPLEATPQDTKETAAA